MPRDVQPGDEPGTNAAKGMGLGIGIAAILAVLVVVIGFLVMHAR
jgi:hypothetical protein